MFLLKLLFCMVSYGFDITSYLAIQDPKYTAASKVAIQAAYKQSGYEAKVNNVKDVTTANAFKWVKDNKLSNGVAIISAVVPVVMNKRIEVHSGNFIINATQDRQQVTWLFSF